MSRAIIARTAQRGLNNTFEAWDNDQLWSWQGWWLSWVSTPFRTSSSSLESSRVESYYKSSEMITQALSKDCLSSSTGRLPHAVACPCRLQQSWKSRMSLECRQGDLGNLRYTWCIALTRTWDPERLASMFSTNKSHSCQDPEAARLSDLGVMWQ